MGLKYNIIDWAGNVLNYNGIFVLPEFSVPMVFDHFDQASDWLSERFGHLNDDEYEVELGEYSIIEVK